MKTKSYMKCGLFLIGAITAGSFLLSSSKPSDEDPFEAGKLEGVHYNYQLYDPETAPENIRESVVKGYHFLLETRKLLPEYAGDNISCTNCHFSAGNTFGGPRNGLPLVGVSHHYPKLLKNGQEYTLAERINGCFLRSMNGKPLPLDSKEMQAMVAYLNWISSDIPKLPAYPWLGVKEIRSSHTPDPDNGKKIYEIRCAMCHGKDGGGQQRPDDLSYPPLWGQNSFNDAAGMNQVHTFTFFVHQNMPYDNPVLTWEEALDVASFVTKQPRPHFTEEK